MKVLVVEDDTIIGLDLVAMLGDWGYAAKGPVGSVEKALEAVEACDLDAVILDLWLKEGALSEPVARALNIRGIPFLCLTALDPSDYGNVPAFAKAASLQKPVSAQELRAALESLLSGAGSLRTPSGRGH